MQRIEGAPVHRAILLALRSLERSLLDGHSDSTSLKLWSEFVRMRDGYRCVLCRGKKSLAAHHICRRTFLPQARFQTGNGITLCMRCHSMAHAGFNGRPDTSLPMDAQGGEKIEVMTGMFRALLDCAEERGILSDELYFLSDEVLTIFKEFQGFQPTTQFPGVRLMQATVIWDQAPLQTRNALLRANGFPESQQPVLPGITIQDDGEELMVMIKG